MKKLLATNILTSTALSVVFLSRAAFAQEQAPFPPPAAPNIFLSRAALAQEQAPLPPPSAPNMPANPADDNIPPSQEEEKAETSALQAKREELLKAGIIKQSDLPPAEQKLAATSPSQQENNNALPISNNTPLADLPKIPAYQETGASNTNPQGTPFSPIALIHKQQDFIKKQQAIIGSLEDKLQNHPQQNTNATPSSKNRLFFNEADNPPLSLEEKVSLQNIQKWQSGTAVKPIIGKNGSVEFTYGTQIPSILAAPMQVTDLQLQQGEKVTNINIGDAARWKIDPAITGIGDATTEHLMIKPLENGIQTSLVITTDKRTYHISLKSHLTKFMPYVTFFYADEAQAALNTQLAKEKAAEVKEKTDNTIPETGEYLGNLDFHYCIKGNAPWKPLRAYNDGHKTMIDLPDDIRNQAAPTLLVSEPYSKTPGLVNSRLVNNRFIVDQIFGKARLIIGVGKYQKKITIRKGVC